MQSIGAYEAKTHLPRLLDRVVQGESLTITRHGRPVARLVPVGTMTATVPGRLPGASSSAAVVSSGPRLPS